MRYFFHNIVSHFGFDTFHDFATSMIHFNLLKISAPVGVCLGLMSSILGFADATSLAFFVMVLFELISGVTASVFEGKKIESRKFSRFGFKLLTWLVLMGVLNTFKSQYNDGVLGWMMNTMASSVVGYILFEYVLSIVENLERITGKSIPLKKFLLDLFDKFINKN